MNKIEKEMNKFGKGLYLKITAIQEQFSLSNQDMKNILNISSNINDSLALPDVVELGCYGYCQFCDCFSINYDSFMNDPIIRIKKGLNLRNRDEVMNKIQETIRSNIT